MRGLSGKAAGTMAARMAELHNVKIKRIYSLTSDLRPGRKKRADAGKRSFVLEPGTDVWKAAQLVVGGKMDLQLALDTIQLRNPDAKLPTLETFRRIMAENGLGKKALTSGRRAYHSWEAEFPGEMFQVDVTALKVRWKDEKTRRILRIEGVDKNHPQMDATKIRVWQIMLIDDHSRRRFLRYIATTHVTSKEMVKFLCEAFGVLGVPHKLYTDNGSEFKGQHVKATRILNTVLAKDGGYQHIPHMPGNSQASGKVEVAHKWAEKMDRLVGLAIAEGQIVTMERLNEFADNAAAAYNDHPHRTTRQTPMARWFGKRQIVRIIPAEIIESALLSDEFEVTLEASMTVSHKGVSYKLPGVQPFVNYVGQKVKVVVPPSIDLILLTLPDGVDFEIEKVLATADKAGEFTRVADSNAEQKKKELRAGFREDTKAIKAKNKLTGEIAPIPYFNVPIEQPATNVANFPHAERVLSHEEVAAVTPIPEPVYLGKDIGYWQGVAEYATRFEGGVDEAKEFLLGVFPSMAGELPASEVEAAIDSRHDLGEARLLRAV